MNRYRIALLSAGLCLGIVGLAHAQAPATKGADKPLAPDDKELVEKLLASRKQYQNSMTELYTHYVKTGDTERARWVETELKGYFAQYQPSYRLDISDVPSPNLVAKDNIKAANDQYMDSMNYKGKGYGQEYALNQRRAEILLQDLLTKYPTSDKIADVAYQLGDLYEDKTLRQYNRAAAYFERAAQWRKGTATDARIRAARIYDKFLNERGKAIELYREVLQSDTDQTRIKDAEKRLAELTSTRK